MKTQKHVFPEFFRDKIAMSFYQKVYVFFVISTIYNHIVKQYSVYDKSLEL